MYVHLIREPASSAPTVGAPAQPAGVIAGGRLRYLEPVVLAAVGHVLPGQAAVLVSVDRMPASLTPNRGAPLQPVERASVGRVPPVQAVGWLDASQS